MSRPECGGAGPSRRRERHAVEYTEQLPYRRERGLHVDVQLAELEHRFEECSQEEHERRNGAHGHRALVDQEPTDDEDEGGTDRRAQLDGWKEA